ncbi:MAG: hypothetical protein BGO47_14495 [Microbacterium sp. 67-17]|uniref:hypothetical protein n=1 Tax=Microbacterium sp. 67-17 TaxID=1895782 RepID=UPI000966C6F8|nr:hypothetical protein [Microbacterium sp. 67-17]OJV98968.1 MAG: hypothetical protein BGO47_14495 [Microbacterium sp. 67-17]
MATNAERLRSAYSRATGPALIVGTVVGAVLGLLVVQIVGSAAPWGVALTFGVAGVVTAAIAAGLSLAVLAGMNTYVSPSPHVRVAAATLTASVATAMVSLALLWMLFLRGVLWIAAIAGVVAAIVALGLALAAERRAPTLPQPARRDHIPSGIALWPLGAAMLLPIGGASSIFLLRAQLHVQCGIYVESGVSQVEANGSWVCADGISYLIPGIILICGPLVFAVVGAVIAHLVVRDVLARLVLALLAVASVAWVLGWTWYASGALVSSTPPGIDSLHYWYLAVGPAAAVAAAGLVVGLVALLARLSGTGWMLGLAIGAMIFASLLSLGVSAGTFVAAGLLGAAYGRGLRREHPCEPRRNVAGASDDAASPLRGA